MRQLASEGKTILISSHILEEVETLADRILLMVSGKLAASGDFRAIRAKLDEQPYTVRVVSDSPRAMASALVEMDGIESVSMAEDGEVVVLSKNVEAAQPLSTFVHIALAKLAATFALAAPVVVASGVVATARAASRGGVEVRSFTTSASPPRGVRRLRFDLHLGRTHHPTRAFYGLVYVLVWEGILSSFLTGVRYLSVRGYTLSLLHGIDAKNFEILEERVIAFPAAIVGAVGVALVFFFLAQLHAACAP
ncbi:hypothetical protein GBAR_LOCUS7036 [Geodia barretti]|uniref:ABC transporter ATP-binding protein n=1 Tax=Geodia barretti TaxID=519541 RepID=A0AA35RIG8_GEOBA|nr:hypothetical protein GBAR_LOCUS7036 [Geodia barretti]